MFHEIKPKKAKYAFSADFNYNLDFSPKVFIETVMAGVPESQDTWFKIVSNSMGAQYVTVYFNDEVLYEKFKAANNAGISQPMPPIPPKFRFPVGARIRHHVTRADRIVCARLVDEAHPDILYYFLDDGEFYLTARIDEFYDRIG